MTPDDFWSKDLKSSVKFQTSKDEVIEGIEVATTIELSMVNFL
jgi:hypothetical protein